MSKAQVPGIILIGLLLLALFVDRAYMPKAPEVPPEVDFSQIPMRLAGGWKGLESTFEDRVLKSFSKSQMLRRIYQRADGQVEVVVVYGPNDEFHTPESCLFGGGWTVEKVDLTQMQVEGESLPFQVKTLRVKDQTGQIAIVSYWLSSETVRAATSQGFLWGRLMERLKNQKPSASAFVRVSDWNSASEEKMRANVEAANKVIGPYIARMVKSDASRQMSKM